MIKHKVATTYHLQSSGQAELSNREIKRILKNVVNPYRKNWSKHLDGVLLDYRIAFKTPLGMYPFRLIYDKAFHLPIELQHKSFWIVKKLNFNLKVVGKARVLQLNELGEHIFFSYENSKIYKEKTKNGMIRNVRKGIWYKEKQYSCLTQAWNSSLGTWNQDGQSTLGG